MSGGISIRVDDAEARRLIGAIAGRMEDTEALMESLGIVMTERARLQFVDQKDPWGQAWKPLSERTLAMRRQGPNPSGSVQILRDTGVLMNSIAYQATKKRVAVGTHTPYAAIHQTGGMIGGAEIARRAYFPIPLQGELPGDWQRDLIETLTAWLEAPYG